MGSCNSPQKKKKFKNRTHTYMGNNNRLGNITNNLQYKNHSNSFNSNNRQNLSFNYGKNNSIDDKIKNRKTSPYNNRNNSKNSDSETENGSKINYINNNLETRHEGHRRKSEYKITFKETEINQIRKNNSNKKNKKRRNSNISLKQSKTLNNEFCSKKLIQKMGGNLAISSELVVNYNSNNLKDQYDIIKQIGKGGFGAVWKVRHIKTGLIRAMKRIPKPKNLRVNLNSLFSEIDILKKLDHPNILKIFEYFVEADGYYLITEYCEGGELFKLIKNNHMQLSEEKIADIMYHIFDGVYYCHSNNVLHRDLKPENILIESLDKNGFFTIKIIDFGTAKIFEKHKLEHNVIGSPFYIAPEVLKQNYNEKCDIWSCGVILYYLLFSKLPFYGRNEYEIYTKIKSGEYELNENDKGISEEAKDLIKKCLELNVSKRIKAKDAKNHKWFSLFKTRERLLEVDKESFNKIINNLLSYNPSNDLQIIALTYLVHNFPNIEEIKIINKVYKLLNVSGNGKLDKKECKKGLMNHIKYKNLEELDEKINFIFSNIDNDNNGFIECEEFCRGGINKKIFLDTQILRFIFDYLDKDKSGEVSLEELKQVFCVRDDDRSEKLLLKIIGEIDTDGNGEVSFEEFQYMMKQITLM